MYSHAGRVLWPAGVVRDAIWQACLLAH